MAWRRPHPPSLPCSTASLRMPAATLTEVQQLFRAEVHPPLWQTASSPGSDLTGTTEASQALSSAVTVSLLHLVGASDLAVLLGGGTMPLSLGAYEGALLRAVDGILAPPFPNADHEEAMIQEPVTPEQLLGVHRDGGVEAFFVLLATELVTLSLAAPLWSPTTAAHVLPFGLARAAEAVAHGVFALEHVECAAEADAGRHLRSAVVYLWHTFTFCLLQQLAARMGGLPPWTGFFTACKAAMVARGPLVKDSFVISDDDDEDDTERPLPLFSTLEGCGLRLDVSPHVVAKREMDALTAYGYLATSDLVQETVGRTRFRRAALLFKSFSPHMVTQAPGTSFFLYTLLTQFADHWRERMQRIPVGHMSRAAQRRLAASWETHSRTAVTGEKNEGLCELEKSLVSLVTEYTEHLSTVLGESAAHGYLLSCVLGAALCSAYVMPLSRQATASALSRRPTAASIRQAATAAVVTSGGGVAGGPHMSLPSFISQRKPSDSPPCLLPRPMRGSEASCGETEWRLRKYPPWGLLLRQLRIHTFCQPHLFSFSTQLCIGITAAQHVDGREKLALFALLSDVCDVRTALMIYHYAPTPPVPSNGRDGTPAPTPPFAAVAAFTAAMAQYAKEAESELIFDLPGTAAVGVGDGAAFNHRGGGRGGGQRGVEGPSSSGGGAVRIPSHGERHGDRFCHMRCPEIAPVWQHVVLAVTEAAVTTAGAVTAVSGRQGEPAAAIKTVAAVPGSASSNSSMHITPYRFVMELLAPHYYALSHDFLLTLQQQEGVDVFAIPRGLLPSGMVSIPCHLMESVSRQLSEGGGENLPAATTAAPDEVIGYLREVLPLLSLANTYLASQTFLTVLLERCAEVCQATVKQCLGNHSTANSIGVDKVNRVREVFALAEAYVVKVVLPGMRVLPPSPILYDRLQDIMVLWKKHGPTVRFGTPEGLFFHLPYWLQHLLPRSGLAFHRLAAAATAVDDEAVLPPTSYPHDILRCKELEALFHQSLKRMNDVTVDHYRALLRPVMYAEPLYVAERLLTMAVGYENSFLALHTRLLQFAPLPLLDIIFACGLALMHQFANEEKVGGVGDSRVSVIAHFVAALWRSNIHAVDGHLLVRGVEIALRSDKRSHMLVGTELLKALLFELSHRKLEHEEQYTNVQLRALVLPAVAREFGKGAMESFRVSRWGTWLTPIDMVAGRAALKALMNHAVDVPLVGEADGSNSNDSDVDEGNKAPGAVTYPQVLTLTLGQHILLHLCRLHSRIYELQADLEGTMEVVLLTTAKDFNVLNDLIFAVEELLVAGPPEARLVRTAMPHMALRLTSRLRLKGIAAAHHEPNVPAPSPAEAVDGMMAPPALLMGATLEEADAAVWCCYANTMKLAGVNYELLRHLSLLTAAHFEVDHSAYDAALKEARLGLRAAQNNTTMSAAALRDTVAWYTNQLKHIEDEQAAHSLLVSRCGPARQHLARCLRAQVLAHEGLTPFVTTYLLPRALLGLEEAAFVHKFLAWLMHETRSDATARQRVVDLTLTLLTAAFTFFVGLSDAESKRVGYVLQNLLEMFDTEAMDRILSTPPALVVKAAARRKEQEKAAAAAATDEAASVGGPAAAGGETVGTESPPLVAVRMNEELFRAALQTAPRSLYAIGTARQTAEAAARQSSKTAKACAVTATKGASAVPLAYPLQLEAYLCRVLTQTLGNTVDVPAHIHRNCFLVLERVDKTTFPSTQIATELLMRVVTPHADKSRPNYASASAVLKALRENLHRKRAVISPLTTVLAERVAGRGGYAVRALLTDLDEEEVEEAQLYLHTWRLREGYLAELLMDELRQFDRGDVVGDNDDTDSSSDASEAEETTDRGAAAAADDASQAEEADAEGSPADVGSEEGSSGDLPSICGSSLITDEAHVVEDGSNETSWIEEEGHGSKRSRSPEGENGNIQAEALPPARRLRSEASLHRE